MSAARQQRPLSERELQQAVIDTARRLGWRVMGVGKVRDKSGYWRTNWLADGKGWPDLTLVRGPWMLCVELKVGANRPEPEQKLWRDALSRVPGVVTAVWFDKDWHNGKVEAVLANPAPHCPVYGEARTTSECEVCCGNIVECPVYGPGERRRLAADPVPSERGRA